ncbi:polyphosphate kinase 2 family protein [Lutibaculum baratangense]|uniref:Polyphosphate kinase-2-related domain-containing protein n=1 Tax=Lutibaculum baratangense AMV1 TaxID=631454 RepID=V4R6D6_9HYPH|nr:DUF344 domain-containing protein [Lutibaculum baratangense]ESR27502.1 protein of unknown function DUF344 [Lutibaculum baratangense AMV1]
MTREHVQHPPKLSDVDLSKRLPHGTYDDRLKELQTRLKEIQQAYLYTKDMAVIVFEGWDAAGKGGTIRRMSAVLDPRGFKVWPIAAPRPRELEQHYLQRFWTRLPARGEIAVFDRSWYGRVLVERVEGYAEPKDWKRAYGEINEFERMLVDDGARVVKIFLYVSQKEQLRRFQERLSDPLKRWKLSYEDFRNRKKWAEYEEAADEMLQRTHTEHAPWLVVPSDSKHYARIVALEEIAARLSKGVELGPRQLGEQVEAEAKKILSWDGVD